MATLFCVEITGDGPVRLAVAETQADLSYRATAKVVGAVGADAEGVHLAEFARARAGFAPRRHTFACSVIFQDPRVAVTVADEDVAVALGRKGNVGDAADCKLLKHKTRT